MAPLPPDPSPAADVRTCRCGATMRRTAAAQAAVGWHCSDCGRHQ